MARRTSPLVIAGPDGALWFTEWENNRIGRMTVAGGVSEYTIPTRNSAPYGIAAGPDDAAWFIEMETNNVGRIGK